VRIINGRYELVAPLAAGGMGSLWEGRDQRLNRKVAVKFVRHDRSAGRDDVIRRFYREARITARLRHQGIPVLYDFGTDDDDLFIVMELITGHTAAELIAEVTPLPISWAAAIGAQVCAALAAAHELSLVHRDLKPANVMMCPDGTVKVLDFGLATATDMAEFSQITRSGEAPGTASYMAPEIAAGNPADARSDLYSVGCLLYELLTASRVFRSPDPATEVGRHMSDSPEPVRRIRPDVPAEMDRLTLELLNKRPEERPADSAAVFSRLLPYVVDVPPLLGVIQIDAATDPVHMYAIAVERISRIRR
jgi:eukaryotic-like serine/threonine-protein kinase